MSAFRHAFDWARREVDSGRLPVAVLGIATAEGIQDAAAFGAVDGRPATVEDHFPLFSVTKPLVGLTALRLIEQGRLSPQTPLSEAVPEFGSWRDDVVRLTHLASHTAGIPTGPLDAPEGLRAALLAPSRDFAAGTMSRYSSIAFEGIGALIEHAGGRPWEDQLNALCVEAGAEGVTFDADASPYAITAEDAPGFDYARFVRLHHPGAGAFARTADLLAVGSSLLRDDGAAVGSLGAEAMTRSLTDGIPKLEPFPESMGQQWGFTWSLRTAASGLLARDVFGHSGWAGCQFWITPSRGVCYALLTCRPAPARLGVDYDLLQNAVDAGAE